MPDETTDGQHLLQQRREANGKRRNSKPPLLGQLSEDKRLPGRPSEQVCPDCGDALWIVTLPSGEDILAPCGDCARRNHEREFIQESLELAAQMSPLHSEASLEEFVTDLPHQVRGKAAVEGFLSEMRRGHPLALVLWSQGYGTGKTHLASAIANEARRRGWIVESWLMPEFLSKVRASYDRDSEYDEYSIVRQATGAHLLVLDDLGKEHVVTKAWYQEKVYRIVNARYQRGPLVITTNTDIADLAKRIGGAAFSRLWEMTAHGQRIVDMRGPDWRFR